MSTAASLVDPARNNDSRQTTRKRHFQVKTVCGTGHCPHRQVDLGKIRTQPDSKRSWAKNTGFWSSTKMLPREITNYHGQIASGTDTSTTALRFNY